MNLMNLNSVKRINEYFGELVPSSGAANTVAGEIVRASARIGYRYLNDGDKINVGYGNETCNAPARYLSENCNGEIQTIVEKIMDDDYWLDEDYELELKNLFDAIIEFLDNNPESFKTENNDDYLNYEIPDDYNYWDEEDDDEEEW